MVVQNPGFFAVNRGSIPVVGLCQRVTALPGRDFNVSIARRADALTSVRSGVNSTRARYYPCLAAAMAHRDCSPGEELANRVTHGLGAVFSIAGLVLLVISSIRHGDAWQVVSTVIFGATLVLLYMVSTLYHSFRSERHKQLLRKFDHAAIFLLIAGTYTPFVLVTLRGPWGWSLFGVVWGLATAGVALKFWFAGRFTVLSTLPGGAAGRWDATAGGRWTLLYRRGGLLSLAPAALPPRHLASFCAGRERLPLGRGVLLCDTGG